MIEQTSKAWYISRRGELLAEEFLLELEPSSLSYVPSDTGIDYMAIFKKADESLVVISVVVKATEHVHGEYRLSSFQARMMWNMNIPVLLVVVDAKENDIYFTWIRDAISAEHKNTLDKVSTCRIKLRLSAPEEIKKLRQEILQQ